ncbi:hypothetical protein [Streptomyces yaizuensis]|uniref:Secreted protein n=1 Tax=Streptomyces yaizuensis TaxID=2989713 RepID=A0ABQ5P2P6_9ACTN|nr:hypothetical protein [Streptomyces sp. YSPA8]GLF96772.1 hypothetical protein SYYSPA8_20765 [Streptomyces sp. YSPA8]
MAVVVASTATTAPASAAAAAGTPVAGARAALRMSATAAPRGPARFGATAVGPFLRVRIGRGVRGDSLVRGRTAAG